MMTELVELVGGGGTSVVVESTTDNNSCDVVNNKTSSCRVTGSSCLALRNAVNKLNRLDDFYRESIGSGFFSEVYKVRHKTTGQVMVLKMNLLRSNRPNMRKEVQLMNQLSHPNILKFMGVCVHEGQLHALTEYINGGRLEQIIQDRSVPLGYSVRMKLALDVAKGMEYLHSKGVFHRDLTSKNILVRTNEETGEMTAVVGDFGFAAKIPRCGFRLATVGSAYWMSPECLKGEFYDELSDVFSFGIVLCELIGRCEADPDVMPRTESFGLDYIAFTRLCVSDPPPPAFLRLAFTSCSYDPSKRPSFSEIVTTLESIIWNAKNPSSKDNTSHPSGSMKKQDERILRLGQAMAELDVHYKPSQQNPFTNIALKTGKKLMVECSCSSSTELLEPQPAAGGAGAGAAGGGGGGVVAEPVVKPSVLRRESGPLRRPSGPWLETNHLHHHHHEPVLRTERKPHSYSSLLDVILADSAATARPRARCSENAGGLPPSLPSSPTFSRRRLAGGAGVSAGAGGSSSERRPEEGEEDGKLGAVTGGTAGGGGGGASAGGCCAGGSTSIPAAVGYRLRACSSGSNLASLEDHTSLLRRRGSCESGFFSSVGDDFYLPECYLLGGHELVASSVTLSSSSAASSLLLDSGTGGEERLHRCRPNRASSVYTGSSEDISLHSDQTEGESNHKLRPQQIHKMVEYFERKGKAGCGGGGSGGGGGGGSSWEQQREYLKHFRPCARRSAAAGATGSLTNTSASLSSTTSVRSAARLLVCEGAVSSKLQIFDRKS